VRGWVSPTRGAPFGLLDGLCALIADESDIVKPPGGRSPGGFCLL
jgi:hypothetical protein